MNKKFGKGVSYLRDISSYVQKNVKPEEIEKTLNTIENLKKYFKDYKFEY